MRSFGIMFAQRHPQEPEVRKAFAITKTLDEWYAVIDRWYGA
jgi:hypothetical protein